MSPSRLLRKLQGTYAIISINNTKTMTIGTEPFGESQFGSEVPTILFWGGGMIVEMEVIFGSNRVQMTFDLGNPIDTLFYRASIDIAYARPTIDVQLRSRQQN